MVSNSCGHLSKYVCCKRTVAPSRLLPHEDDIRRSIPPQRSEPTRGQRLLVRDDKLRQDLLDCGSVAHDTNMSHVTPTLPFRNPLAATPRNLALPHEHCSTTAPWMETHRRLIQIDPQYGPTPQSSQVLSVIEKLPSARGLGKRHVSARTRQS